MGRIEKSIEIGAPPEKVWEMLALDRLPEWNKEYGNVKYTSEVLNPEDKYRIGASSHTNIKGAGAIDFEITESLENEKMTFSLEPMEGGTKMGIVFDYEMPWGVFGKFLEKLFARRMEEKHQKKCLEKLKGILEK